MISNKDLACKTQMKISNGPYGFISFLVILQEDHSVCVLYKNTCHALINKVCVKADETKQRLLFAYFVFVIYYNSEYFFLSHVAIYGLIRVVNLFDTVKIYFVLKMYFIF